MNITKPNTMQLASGVGILLAFVGTFLTWWKLDVGGELEKMAKAAGGSLGYSGLDYTKGVFVLIFAILAIVVFVATLVPTAFPENVQLYLLGAPVVLFALGVLAFLLTLIGFFSAGDIGTAADLLGDEGDSKRGLGLFITLIGTLVWVGVTAVQTKQILAMAQAMKAAQPPAA